MALAGTSWPKSAVLFRIVMYSVFVMEPCSRAVPKYSLPAATAALLRPDSDCLWYSFEVAGYAKALPAARERSEKVFAVNILMNE